MAISRLGSIFRSQSLLQRTNPIHNFVRTSSKSGGSLPPQPEVISFGIIRLILTVVPGLLIGAAISKNIANFLEENDLFVPSDDDDDDD